MGGWQMKASLDFEVQDQGATIQWVIKLNTESQWFFNIAARAYKAIYGSPLNIEQKQIEGEK